MTDAPPKSETSPKPNFPPCAWGVWKGDRVVPSLFNGSLYVTIIRREGGKLSIALNRQGTSELMRILGDLVSQLPCPTPTRAADIPDGPVPTTA